MDKSIIPECYADTLLVETLAPSNRGYNHQYNCFKVEGALKRLDEFGVGIIDKDKKQIKYLESFVKVDEIAGDLILWRHKNEQVHHWIIQICPALEKWLLKICKAEEVDLSDFEENSLEGLKHYTKSTVRLNDPKLIKLFKTINQTNNILVRKLKGWISLLKEKNYKVDKNELVNV
jgi:DNA-directed RNA polymerase subunit F